jgi:hypothetical protein
MVSAPRGQREQRTRRNLRNGRDGIQRYSPIYVALTFILDLSRLVYNNMDLEVQGVTECAACEYGRDEGELVCRQCTSSDHQANMRVHEEKAIFFARLLQEVNNRRHNTINANDAIMLRLHARVIRMFQQKETMMAEMERRKHDLLVERENGNETVRENYENELRNIETEVENINRGFARARRRLYQENGGRAMFRCSGAEMEAAQEQFEAYVVSQYPGAITEGMFEIG